jgi:outer membrane protein OmpA-like peptidoglycan-associated protein
VKAFFILLLGFVLSLHASAQTRTFFNLTDTTFETGSAYTSCDVIYDLDGHSHVRPESYPCLDSVADFMKKHPEMIFEIDSYTDQRGGDSANLKLSQGRANMVEKYLVDHGVPSNVLAAVGYGEDFPLNSQAAINAVADKDQKEKLYQQNRRTEFRIIYIYRAGIFSLTDTSFSPGATLSFPVLFDLGKSTMRPEGIALVDSLAKFLIAHPELSVEVGNHTDMRASTASCSKPTMARAQSIVDRLVLDGVPRTQILAKGYGETHPLITEKYISLRKSKEGREQLYRINRRTEIRILSVN